MRRILPILLLIATTTMPTPANQRKTPYELLAPFMEQWRALERLEARPSRWVPHTPHPRQKLFLSLRDVLEVFYGGAAGGGKSDSLLMAALEYADVPGYSALLLRRTYADLSKPKALMSRAREWLGNNTGARWYDPHGEKQWIFPSGATLSFGYLENLGDLDQYQSAEYQFVGFDEVTQFSEEQYKFLFSRLRRLQGVDVPIRMRSASNPASGALGRWVKTRFVPDDFVPDDAIETKVWWKQGTDGEGNATTRAFVPARLEDNPSLDKDEYERSLAELDPTLRAQLRRGDWRIHKRGNIYPMYSEYYHVVPWSKFAAIFKSYDGQGHAVVPDHWRLGISQDWGFEHLCVTGCLATAAANGPLAGSVFLHKAWSVNKMTAPEIAEGLLLPWLGERNRTSRIERWLMSHEAVSQMAEYNKRGLPFGKWGQDANGGIEQVRAYLEVRDKKKPHPFGNVGPDGEALYGRPLFYLLVDDDQVANPVDDGGLAEHRAEFMAYSYRVPKSGEMPSRERPQESFNDAMDQLRCYAAQGFPDISKLSAVENALARMDESLRPENLPYNENPMAEISAGFWMKEFLDEQAAEKKGGGDFMKRLGLK